MTANSGLFDVFQNDIYDSLKIESNALNGKLSVVPYIPYEIFLA
jgi:hypothetical protein